MSTVEPETGATFHLPRATEPERRAAAPDGSTAAATGHQTQVIPGISLSVAFAGASGLDYSAEGLESIFDQLVAALEDGGADDLEVLRYEPGTVQGRPAVDDELTFTATNGSTNHWFVHEDGHQVLAEYHQLAVDGLTLP